MAIPLRTRLTLWYSALLLLALVLFSATVLWLQWRLLVHQADEALDPLGGAAAHRVAAELEEGETLARAAGEMADVAPRRDYAVVLLDPAGRPIGAADAAMPFDDSG